MLVRAKNSTNNKYFLTLIPYALFAFLRDILANTPKHWQPYQPFFIEWNKNRPICARVASKLITDKQTNKPITLAVILPPHYRAIWRIRIGLFVYKLCRYVIIDILNYFIMVNFTNSKENVILRIFKNRNQLDDLTIF